MIDPRATIFETIFQPVSFSFVSGSYEALTLVLQTIHLTSKPLEEYPKAD